MKCFKLYTDYHSLALTSLKPRIWVRLKFWQCLTVHHLLYCIYPEYIDSVRPNKKIPVLRVTRPYQNLLVKPRLFPVFWEKNILCEILWEMPFKMHKIISPPPPKKKHVCLPYLKFSHLLPETHLLFYLALLNSSPNIWTTSNFVEMLYSDVCEANSVAPDIHIIWVNTLYLPVVYPLPINK